MASEQRLDGWKAIAAYLGRDRSKIMRWQRERDLPIRRMPGGKQSTVYALVDELDAWIKGSETELQNGANIFAGEGQTTGAWRALKWVAALLLFWQWPVQ